MSHAHAKPLLALLVIAPLLTAGAPAQALTRDDVVRLHQDGVPPGEVIAAVEASPTAFALTADEVEALRAAGVPDAVVVAMLFHAPEPPPELRSVHDVARLSADGVAAAALIRAIEANPPFAVSPAELELARLSDVPAEVLVALVLRSRDMPARREDAPARPTTRVQQRADPLPPLVEERRGLVLGAGVGVNLCVADDGADCDGVDPSAALDASLGFRLSQWASLALDLSYADLRFDDALVERPVSAWVFAAMLTGRAHVPLTSALDLDLGLGVGYASWQASDGVDEVSWSTLLAYKVTLGVSYRVHAALDIGLAFTLIAHPDNGTCVPNGVNEACGEVDAVRDIAERATVVVRAAYRFD